jgi:hypothetical protein
MEEKEDLEELRAILVKAIDRLNESLAEHKKLLAEIDDDIGEDETAEIVDPNA